MTEQQVDKLLELGLPALKIYCTLSVIGFVVTLIFVITVFVTVFRGFWK